MTTTTTVDRRIDRIAAAKEALNIVEELERRGISVIERGSSTVCNCPWHDDRNPSCTIYPEEGRAHCYACGNGGDVLDVVCHLDQRELSDVLAELEVTGQIAASATSVQRTAVRQARPQPLVILPVPATAEPLMRGTTGKTQRLRKIDGGFTTYTPEMVFGYRTQDGQLNGYVVRLEIVEGGEITKLTPAITWCRWPDGSECWTVQGFPRPHPIYGLDRINDTTERVLIVEGEKAASAGNRLLEDSGIAVVSASNGAQCYGAEADWSSLVTAAAGRPIVFWRDADKAGMGAQADCAYQLQQLGVKLLAVEVPATAPRGWDIADAEEEGWTAGQALALIDAATPAAIRTPEETAAARKDEASAKKTTTTTEVTMTTTTARTAAIAASVADVAVSEDNDLATAVVPSKLSTKVAADHVLDAAYRTLTGFMPLADQHRALLHTLGLDDAQISANGYVSLPADREARRRAAAETAYHLGDDAVHVPGLITDGGVWDVSASRGVLIPSRNRDGLVVGLVCRGDKPTAAGNWYYPLSSAGKIYGTDVKRGGASAVPSVHYPVGIAAVDTVRVVVGVLEADVMTEITDTYTVGVPRLRDVSLATAAALDLGVKRVILAIAPDCTVDLEHATTVYNTIAALRLAEIDWSVETWPATAGALSDALRADEVVRVIEGECCDSLLSDLESLYGFSRSGAANAAVGQLERASGGAVSRQVFFGGLDRDLRDVPAAAEKLRQIGGYIVSANGVQRDKNFGKLTKDDKAKAPDLTQVCYAPVIPTAMVHNVTTGESSVDVTFHARGKGWRTVTMPRRDAVDSRRIVEYANQDLPVSSSTAGELTSLLEQLIINNEDLLRVRYASERLGLVRLRGSDRIAYLLGDSLVTADGVVPASQSDWTYIAPDCGEKDLAAALSTSGSMEGWRDGVAAVIGAVDESGSPRFPAARLCLYASVVPVVQAILEESGFTLDISGRNGSGKTVALHALASVWGQPEGLQVDWSGKAVGLERTAVQMHGLPTYIDDTRKLRDKEVAAQLLYMIGGGKGVVRGSVNGLRSTPTLRTTVISTGEGPIIGILGKQAGGARSRTLCLRYPFGHSKTPEMGDLVSGIDVAAQQHYGHAGAAFVTWLLRQVEECGLDEFRLALRGRQAVLAKRLEAVSCGVEEANRVSKYGARIMVAAELLHNATYVAADGSEQYILPFDMHTVPAVDQDCEQVQVNAVITQELWASIVEHNRDSAGEVQSMQDCYSWFVQEGSNLFRFGDRDGVDGVAGVWHYRDPNWQQIAIIRNVLEAKLTEWSYDPSAVLSAWRDRGWIDAEAGGYTRRVNLHNGLRPAMVVIKRSALEELGIVEK